jgi:hypothetical protein
MLVLKCAACFHLRIDQKHYISAIAGYQRSAVIRIFL